jgi:signal transduction histidine kinase
MRLAQCIQAHMESILAEWDAFARTLNPSSAQVTPRMLRDHAQQILAAVLADLSMTQTAEQAEKSMGRMPLVRNAPETAAQTHAVLRAQSGINISQLAAEYRALRASVLRHWERECQLGPESLQDVIRFNEAIDQALADAIGYFAGQLDRARNLLLGTLGHDMRNPLNAIVMTASGLAELSTGEEISEAAACLIRSGAAMKALLDDLVDFNRTKLGSGINIAVADTDLGALFADEVKLLQTANPTREVVLTVGGEVRGRWDGPRLQQVLRNLVSNACVYGSKEEAVRVGLQGDADGVHFEVKNRGPAIDPATAEQLFDPLRRGQADSHRANTDGLGLGLYIVREIVRAHGGEVELRSDETETVFSVRLPRFPGAPAGGTLTS